MQVSAYVLFIQRHCHVFLPSSSIEFCTPCKMLETFLRWSVCFLGTFRVDLHNFFNFKNSIDPSKKVQFTKSSTTDCVLKFLDVIFSFDVTSKQILVDALSKPTNNLTYLIPSTCFLGEILERSRKVQLKVNSKLEATSIRNI